MGLVASAVAASSSATCFACSARLFVLAHQRKRAVRLRVRAEELPRIEADVGLRASPQVERRIAHEQRVFMRDEIDSVELERRVGRLLEGRRVDPRGSDFEDLADAPGNFVRVPFGDSATVAAAFPDEPPWVSKREAERLLEEAREVYRRTGDGYAPWPSRTIKT
jgi:hypothetical protein